MQLSVRLSAIAQYVPNNSQVIDVGTDHAYIPIHLRQTGQAKTCIATDINKGPLEKAAKNVSAHGIKDIRLVQTNGLQGLEEEQPDVIMISGMGGYLTIDILKAASPLVEKAKRLILQPQQDIDQVRRYLHASGFKIIDEDFVKDEEKYYTVIVAEQGNEQYKQEIDYLYGQCLMKKQLPVFKEWIALKLQKQEGILTALGNQSSPHILKRQQELKQEIEGLKEVTRCLS